MTSRLRRLTDGALNPVDPASAQAACLELTEDNEVFAMLGTLRRRRT